MIKQTGPIDNLFDQIKIILSNIEIKDNKLAAASETTSSIKRSELWLIAKNKQDTYATYKNYWTNDMFQRILPNITTEQLNYYKQNPLNVPLEFQDELLISSRNNYLNSYIEENDYYRTLIGLPPIDSTDFIYVSQRLGDQYNIDSTIPVHQLSDYAQQVYMNTEEYQQVLIDNSDKKYLKYIGVNKIDLFSARMAKDFEIIKYPSERNDINNSTLTSFAKLYADYREYVISTLYNENLDNIYNNYRSFMGVIIMSFTLMQLSNKATEGISTRRYLDDNVLYTMLSMYGITDSLLMTKDVRRNLVTNLLKLTKAKGTSEVYYMLVDILGYQDIIISKLMLMKGQKFDKENNYQATFDNEDNINSFNDMNLLQVDDVNNPNNIGLSCEPYFVKVGIDDEPYETISNNPITYSYHEIVDNDNTWWDTEDTQHYLRLANYTISDTKYIMLEVSIHQIEYLFETIYFARMILDNKPVTDVFTINIPELFGTTNVSIYDLMLFIITATCMNTNVSGMIQSREDCILEATAGFNFNLDYALFMEYLENTKYVEKDKIKSFLKDITMNSIGDISRVFNNVMYPMRKWLEHKISSSDNRYEYLEYENIYRALYTYDVTNNSFIEDFKLPMEQIQDIYNLSDNDINAYKAFYPHSISGKALTFNDLESNLQYKLPFLTKYNKVTFALHITIEDNDFGIIDRGTLYLYDILNSSDIRTITNEQGDRIFMDYEDEEIGWQLNQKAVDNAIYQINMLSENELLKSYFQVDTKFNGTEYKVGDLLPANIRISGMFKKVLIDKITMDANGICDKPKTYSEYLKRKNPTLYDLLNKGNRFEYDKVGWMEDINKVILAIETELNIHIKYFEQSVVGNEMFFKPLITLINHFKSTFVEFAKTGLRYVLDDKIDSGGNSNLFKLYDEVDVIIHFVVLSEKGYQSKFGLYDATNKVLRKALIADKNSLRMRDVAKFYKNGEEVDPCGHTSFWYPGDYDYIIDGTNIADIKIYNGSEEIILRYDITEWKNNVESYTPVE